MAFVRRTPRDCHLRRVPQEVWPGLVGQTHLLALISASGHGVRECDVFLLTKCIGLAAFFPSKYISTRLGPGASDIHAPNKPNYGDKSYEETPHDTAHNGSDVGRVTLRTSDHFRSRIYRERDPVSDCDWSRSGQRRG